MKTYELAEGIKVITVGTKPVVGFIKSWTCLGGKSYRNQANIFVKIKKLDGGYTYATPDQINRYKSL